MKPFLPFLLIPALSLGGWGLSMYGLSPERLALPAVLALDAPPALGVVVPANDAQEVVRVPVNVLLPPSVRVPAPRGQTALRPPGPPEVPLVGVIANMLAAPAAPAPPDDPPGVWSVFQGFRVGPP